MRRHFIPLIVQSILHIGLPQKQLTGYRVIQHHDIQARDHGSKCHGKRSKSLRSRSNKRKAARLR